MRGLRWWAAAVVAVAGACGNDSEAGTSAAPDAKTGADAGGDAVEGGGEVSQPSGDSVETPLADGPSYECLAAQCPAEPCLGNAECAAAYDCVGDCDTIVCAETCTGLAPPPFKGIVSQALSCGVAASCFSGGSGLTTCGNGTCDEDESRLSCEEDCGLAGNPELIVECMLGSCQTGQCPQIPSCLGGMQCIAACEDFACTQGCINGVGGQVRWFLRSLVVCAVEAECLSPEAGPVCGNGTCDFSEGQLNCPQDCGEPSPGYLCMLEKCEPGQCTQFSSCNEGLICLGECEDAQCSKECIEDGPGQVEGLLLAVGQCAAGSGCIPLEAFPNTPECGNGTCDVDEDLFDCASDCKPPSELCGNGACDLGENPTDCPDDCDPAGASCDGACGLATDGAACHCFPQCEELGSCCADYAAECAAYTCLRDNCDADGCAAADFCSQALACIADCTDASCAEPCKEGQPGQNIEFLDEYISCAANNGCYELNPTE